MTSRQQSATGEIFKHTKALLNLRAARPQPLEKSATDSNSLLDHIATRAYALYEERGYRCGCDLQDWLDAEREILGRQQPI